MANVRCPKHDIIFDTVTDHRWPGAGKTPTQAAMPYNCHPDCPKPGDDASFKVDAQKEAVSPSKTVIARG